MEKTKKNYMHMGKSKTKYAHREMLRRLGASKMHLYPCGLDCCPIWGIHLVVVASLFIVTPVVCGGSVFSPILLCNTWCHFSFAVVLMVRRGLVTLLKLSFWYLVAVGNLRLFIAVTQVGLQC